MKKYYIILLCAIIFLFIVIRNVSNNEHIAESSDEYVFLDDSTKILVKDAKLFTKGYKYVLSKEYKKAISAFDKINKDSPAYSHAMFFRSISNNELNLKIGPVIYIKSNNANVREFYGTDSPIITVLSQGTKLNLCYTYDDWTRIYRPAKNRLIFADDVEINGWIHSSLLENEVEHKKRIANEQKIADKQIAMIKSKRLDIFTNWQANYYFRAPNVVQSIEPVDLGFVLIFQLYLTTLNSIIIENIGIDIAYELQNSFPEERNIVIWINVGSSRVAKVSWDVWSQRYRCVFSDN